MLLLLLLQLPLPPPLPLPPLLLLLLLLLLPLLLLLLSSHTVDSSRKLGEQDTSQDTVLLLLNAKQYRFTSSGRSWNSLGLSCPGPKAFLKQGPLAAAAAAAAAHLQETCAVLHQLAERSPAVLVLSAGCLL
jgi:hypothetical protein